jgi:hypothetical protein
LLRLSQSNLVELLAAWGKHEATGRKEAQAQIDVNDLFACVDFALRYRAPLVARILQLEPQLTLLVEFDAKESNAFVLFDGRSIDAWIQTAQNSNDLEGEYFRTMVGAATPPEGPLVTSAQHRPSSAPLGPIIGTAPAVFGSSWADHIVGRMAPCGGMARAVSNRKVVAHLCFSDSDHQIMHRLLTNGLRRIFDPLASLAGLVCSAFALGNTAWDVKLRGGYR